MKDLISVMPRPSAGVMPTQKTTAPMTPTAPMAATAPMKEGRGKKQGMRLFNHGCHGFLIDKRIGVIESCLRGKFAAT
jgi:hypothetical protein